jgi:hypothetical protein
MTLIEHYQKGYIKELYMKGAINVNFMTYFRYFEVWEAYRKKGLSKNKAYLYASDECGCSKITIMRAVKMLQEN